LTEVTIPDNVEIIDRNAFYYCTDLARVTIGEGVKSIGTNAFNSCPLSILVYQGSYALTTENAFSGSTFELCVPPDYDYNSFCGQDVSSSDTCKGFQDEFSFCNKGTLDGEQFVQKKNKRASEWEDRSNNCAKFICTEEYGLVSWNLCNNTDGQEMMCLNGQCIDSKSLTGDGTRVVVEVEFPDGVPVSDVDPKSILADLRAKGINSDGIDVGWESDERGYVIRLLFYVSDEITAKAVVGAITDMMGTNCQSIWCKAKSVRVVAWQRVISGTTRMWTPLLLLMLMTMIIVIM